MKYLCDTIKKPKNYHLSYESWEAENSMIMSWLLNSMLPKIGKPFLYLSSAKEVWDVVSQTYLKKGKTTRIYELKTMIHNTKQKDLTVTTSYNTLKILWQELDLCQHFEMESTTNASMLVEL